ncbi:MAG TPA: GNAT family N-acetyltransferase [Thermoanaerobaculia bacterium]|nr:GNAT family N-acetyltransferase [Thermoanaerobaculia bacterium]
MLVKVAPLAAPSLTTERLQLRMLQDADFEEYAAIHTDAEVTKYTVRTQLSRMEAWRHLAVMVGHWHLRGFGMWGVFEKSTGALVGRVGFHQPDGWPDFELGWTIGRNWWGKGYATEAAQRCVEFAFAEMDRDRLISLIDPENVASIHVAERIGETLQGEYQLGEHRLLVYGVDRRRPGG